VAAPCARVQLVRGPVRKSCITRPFNGIVRQHVSEAKAIAGAWLFVSALFAVVWWDANWPQLMIAASLSALVAYVGAVSKSRWAGIVLIAGSLALGAAVVFAVFALGAAAHGGGNARPFAIVVAYVVLFGFPVIAVFSFVVGLSRVFGITASDDAKGSMTDNAERHE